MEIKYNREKISDGIHFTAIVNERLKTNTIIIRLVTALSESTASLNAIIPYVLSNSSAEYPTVTELSKKMAELYGGVIRGAVSKGGDSQVISLMAGCINDSYTFDGEAITDKLTEIVIGCLLNPYVENDAFFESDFLLKKQELIDDIDASINDKRSYAFKQAGVHIYENEPAAVYVKGEKKQAEKVTSSEAYKQYKKLLETSQIEVTFVGASEPVSSKKMFTEALSGLKRAYSGDNASEKSTLKSDVCYATERLDVAQSKMVMAFKTDYKDDTAIKLMNSVFGGTPFSKLFLNVREKLSLCYYCSSGYNDNKGVMYVDSGVEHSNIKKAEEEILNQLDAVKNGCFTDEEVNNSRLSMINSLRGVNDGARSLADWYFKQVYAGSDKSPEKEIELLNAVTREDIINAANSMKLDTVYVLTGKENS